MSNRTVSYFSTIVQNAKELNKKEKDILIHRLKTQRLEKVGKKYKVTGERIRQIEEKALTKFKKKMVQLLLID